MKDMQKTIESIISSGKGILAADESTGTIKKRFESINLESNEDSRSAYREILFSAPDLEKYISGVILFEETLYQKTSSGILFTELLTKKGIVPGIKVDQGLLPLESEEHEQVTQGLDGLNKRLIEYKKQGARFAKWRAVFTISQNTPSCSAIKINAELLARYARICQNNGIVPIVEPEVLIDGSHDLETASMVTEKVLHSVFDALYWNKVILELMILKPSMVVAGKDCKIQSDSKEIAKETLKVLRRTVPAVVPTINFLSGGQSDKSATNNLNEINKSKEGRPWNVSFSYGRALQNEALQTWAGKKENIGRAQEALIVRARLNSLATLGVL